VPPTDSQIIYQKDKQYLTSLLDIASPPTGMLSLFNLYVALSRSLGRSTIRLLGDFNEKLFQSSHNTRLLDEDEGLDPWRCHSEVFNARGDLPYGL